MKKPGGRGYFEGGKWLRVFQQNVSWINEERSFLLGYFREFPTKIPFIYASVNASCAQPPPGYCRAICPHCQSRGGALAKLRCQPRGHPLTFDTHVASYPNITTQRIFLEKQADWLISQGREKIVEGSKDVFSILCMHFFIAYQSGIT